LNLSAPYAPPQVPQRRRRGGVVGPLVLIFIGAVFLLENTGYLPPNAWLNLWRLWPLLLVLVQMGATDAHLDLSSLQLNSLDMSVGAAAAQIRLPQVAGTTTAHISGGMSTITLDIPQGVAAQIRHRGGLSTVNVDPNRFPSVGGGSYRSPDYATAQSKVDLTLETGITTIQVN
jgi:hypothetical protein